MSFSGKTSSAFAAALALLACSLVAITGASNASAESAASPAAPGAITEEGIQIAPARPEPAGEKAPSARTSSVRGGGGISVPGKPRVDRVYCVKQCVSTRRATPGSIVRFTGEDLGEVKKVIFPGKDGKMKVKYRARSSTAVRVEVPHGADDGRPYLIDVYGTKSNRAPHDLLILPKSSIPKEYFPVRGPYNYGSSGAGFGAGRPGHIHQGQDVIAACGIKLVSIKKAVVAYSTYEANAGYYVVLKNKGENTSFVYMHLSKHSKLEVGDRVSAGEPIGRVGETGDASGCHLHFEYWIGPWQTGGKPIDPLPYLKSL